jgi:TraX protein.
MALRAAPARARAGVRGAVRLRGVRQRVRHALAEPRVRPRGRADRARHTRPHVRMAHECAQGGAFGRCDHHRPAVGFHAVDRPDAATHERRHCDARHVRDLLLPAFPWEHDGVHGSHIRSGLRIDAWLGRGGAPLPQRQARLYTPVDALGVLPGLPDHARALRGDRNGEL